MNPFYLLAFTATINRMPRLYLCLLFSVLNIQMFDSTKYSGTCKAPFLLKDETHCISRLSSSETASTTLDITRGTKSLEMVNT